MSACIQVHSVHCAAPALEAKRPGTQFTQACRGWRYSHQPKDNDRGADSTARHWRGLYERSPLRRPTFEANV